MKNPPIPMIRTAMTVETITMLLLDDRFFCFGSSVDMLLFPYLSKFAR
jgi:hypothetical protein